MTLYGPQSLWFYKEICLFYFTSSLLLTLTSPVGHRHHYHLMITIITITIRPSLNQ